MWVNKITAQHIQEYETLVEQIDMCMQSSLSPTRKILPVIQAKGDENETIGSYNLSDSDIKSLGKFIKL